jgi:hypothetical protein
MPKGKMPPVPDVSDTLLTYLNYLYPNDFPMGKLDVIVLAQCQGQRSVVQHLEALRQKQSGLQPQ